VPDLGLCIYTETKGPGQSRDIKIRVELSDALHTPPDSNCDHMNHQMTVYMLNHKQYVQVTLRWEKHIVYNYISIANN